MTDLQSERLENLPPAFTALDRAVVADQLTGLVPEMLSRISDDSPELGIGFTQGKEVAQTLPGMGAREILDDDVDKILQMSADQRLGYFLGVYAQQFEEGAL
jgi:hypothetical protein